MKLIKLSVNDQPPSPLQYISLNGSWYRGREYYGTSEVTKYYYISSYHTATLQILKKQSLSIAYKVIESQDKGVLDFFNRGGVSPVTLSMGVYVEFYGEASSNFVTYALGDTRLKGNHFFAWVRVDFTDVLGEQSFSTAPYGFTIYDLDDRRRAEVLKNYYAHPYCFTVKDLPVNAEFLFDYEDTLLPLKEECPVGTSKLLTNNYPGYICVDYQPIENSIKDIRKIIKGF